MLTSDQYMHAHTCELTQTHRKEKNHGNSYFFLQLSIISSYKGIISGVGVLVCRPSTWKAQAGGL